MSLEQAGIGGAQRELEKLAGAGLLTVARVGNQKPYQPNRLSPIYAELRGIVLKTFGLADVLRQALLPLSDRLAAAFIYGSVAKGTDTAGSDIDVMLVGNDLSYADVVTLLAKPEEWLGRAVNPTLYAPTEFARRRAEDNAFVNRVIEQPKIFLLGAEDAIASLG